MKIAIPFAAFFILSSLSGTEYIKAISVAAQSGQPLQYASVHILQHDFYGMTNANGQVFIPARFSENDSLMISCPGYNDKEIAISDLTGATVFLDQGAMQHESPAKAKKKSQTLSPKGSWKEPNSTQVLMLYPGGMALNLFDAEDEFFLLQRLTIKTIPPVFENLQLRIRIYSCDEKTGLPGEDLSIRHIPFKVHPNKREHSVDISENPVLIRKGKFYVGVEMIVDSNDSTDSKLMLGLETMKPAGQHSMMRFRGKSPWFKMPDTAKIRIEGVRSKYTPL